MGFREWLGFSQGYQSEESGEFEKGIVCRDESGKPIYAEDIVSMVNEELSRRKTERQPFELQWLLNSNFYEGNQFCDINRGTGQVEQYVPERDYQERQVYNQIRPLIQTRVANLKKVTYGLKVRPRSNELEDLEKAQTATALLAYAKERGKLDEKMTSLITWAELHGTAFILSWWNPELGEELSQSSTGEHEGDIEYGLLNSYEVFPESVYKENIDDQRTVILDQVISVEDVYDLYGVDVEGKKLSTYAAMPVMSKTGLGNDSMVMSLKSKQIDNACEVKTWFERSSRRYPGGRLIIVINDELIHYGKLPYGKIPIQSFKSQVVPECFFGDSVIKGLIPLQRAYNGLLNSINDYTKQVVMGGYFVEQGSVELEEWAERGNEPGAMIPYKQGFDKPAPIQNAPLPAIISDRVQSLRAEMEYVAGVSQLMVVGATPSGVTSGTAIENLREIDNTRLAVTSENHRDAMKSLGELWLEIYKTHVNGYRVIRILGKNNLANVLVWCAGDINSYDIVYDTQNELLNSEETQKQNFLAAFDRGFFTDDEGKVPQSVKNKAIEYMKINSYTDLMSLNELQVQNAQRENAMARLGVMPTVEEVDDHLIHTEEHEKFALQVDFIMLKKDNPGLADEFMAHIHDHKKLFEAARREALGVEKPV